MAGHPLDLEQRYAKDLILCSNLELPGRRNGTVGVSIASPGRPDGWQEVIARRRISGEAFTAMPVYEYLCRKCGKSFERVESIKEHDLSKVRCPECKSKKVERRWSRVSAVTSKKS